LYYLLTHKSINNYNENKERIQTDYHFHNSLKQLRLTPHPVLFSSLSLQRNIGSGNLQERRALWACWPRPEGLKGSITVGTVQNIASSTGNSCRGLITTGSLGLLTQTWGPQGKQNSRQSAKHRTIHGNSCRALSTASDNSCSLYYTKHTASLTAKINITIPMTPQMELRYFTIKI